MEPLTAWPSNTHHVTSGRRPWRREKTSGALKSPFGMLVQQTSAHIRSPRAQKARDLPDGVLPRARFTMEVPPSPDDSHKLGNRRKTALAQNPSCVCVSAAFCLPYFCGARQNAKTSSKLQGGQQEKAGILHLAPVERRKIHTSRSRYIATQRKC